MQWFRSHRLRIGSLALFALACHFAVTFGHVHLEQSAGALLAAAEQAVPAVVVPAVAKIAAADQPSAPGHHGPGRLRNDYCAVCAGIGLAGAMLLPGAPSVLTWQSVSARLQWAFAPTVAVSAGYFHFDARGPPLA